MANSRITPFVKRMRVNGGTIFVCNSAVEDIGLNINERNNVVKLSYFSLLNIPSILEPSTNINNTFNTFNAINGAFKYNQGSPSIKDGRVIISESFQNYALNLESNLLNRDDYNPSLQRTVSERVFWKWLKETGAIRWTKDASGNWVEEEDGSGNYESVVKYVGQISAGNVRTDTFGTYNETYVLIPTSHGQTKVFFDQYEDGNYKHDMIIPESGNGITNILGRENYTQPHPDGLDYRAQYDYMDSSTSISDAVGNIFSLEYDASVGSYSDGWWWSYYPNIQSQIGSNLRLYITDSSLYLDTSIYNTDLRYKLGGNEITFRRSNVDCMSIIWDETILKQKYGLSSSISESDMYNQIAIEDSINDNFNFNAVLLYYSIYNATLDDVLQTNLLGVLFLDAPSGNSSTIASSGIIIPSLEKIQSGPTGFGTSYSLRLNIKTDNMLDDTTAMIVDESTSNQLYVEDWNDVFYNLQKSLNILSQQNSTMSYIYDQYITLQNNQTQILNNIQSLQYTVNDISRDIQGDAGTVALFSDGDDPLIESSIYMAYGRIGMFNQNPQWGVHIDSSIKTLDIILENAIRDTSDNIILGYGSPLQLGSSTNYRQIDIYSGNILPSISIDTSNNININGDVSIIGNLQVDGSTSFSNITIPSFVEFNTSSQWTSFYNVGSVETVRITNSSGRIDAIDDIVSYSGAISDERLKENFQILDNPLEKVLQLNGISYNRKLNGDKHIGYIAQDVQNIIPEVVIETTLPLESGSDSSLYKIIRYTELIPYLSEAIKEQQKIINELLERVKLLELK